MNILRIGLLAAVMTVSLGATESWASSDRTGGTRYQRSPKSRKAKHSHRNVVVASMFGPGLFGRQTACGQSLTRSLVGVAHRSLPCGTRVTISYQGRRITAPVVDRGPYHRGRKLDLTAAAATNLGFSGIGKVGLSV
jgi:rare lipoprotein A (peptidoglycan hydrolase)